jgi:thiol-disulfide isomerase/thioredoxin
MMFRRFTIVFIAAALFAQENAPKTDPPKSDQAKPDSDPELKALQDALSDGNTSSMDLIRALEDFLKKYPTPPQISEIVRVLARASIELKDDRRTVLYGERLLEKSPDDMLVIDRVAKAHLGLGGRENAEASLKYSRLFEAKIRNAPAPDGRDLAYKQDERDHGISRALLYQSQAKIILGEKADAERLAAKSYALFPSEETARGWSEALAQMDKNDDAIERLADAFTIPDTRALEADRVADRRKLGELYRKMHGTEKGLGDLVWAAYDRTSATIQDHKAHLASIDPNFGATDPTQFTITGLDGKKLPLSALKGSVVVMDFWATWCGPCRAQHPLYDQVKERFKDHKDVVFLSIDTDENPLLVAPFLEQQKWSRSAVYLDDGLQRFLQVNNIPTTILVDKHGRVASRMNGFLPDRFVDQLSARIESALPE